MQQLQGLSVLVLGLGHSGLAMARWCDRFGARVQVWDSRDAPPQAAALAAAVPAAALRSGALAADDLAGIQLVLKSPGLSPHDDRIAPLLAAARAAGVAVAGELDLFASALAELKAGRGYAPKVLAVTGTNGKTTTTAMCALLLERCGLRVAAAGNIGPTMLDTLADALDRETVPSVLVPAVDETDAPVPENAGGDDGEAPDPDDATDAPFDDGEAAEAEDGVESAERAAGVGAGEEADPADPADPDISEDDAGAAAVVAAGDAPPKPMPPPPAPRFAVLPEAWVLELSSFQLHEVQGFEPSAAAVLNITQDHLDWHGDMAAYAASKARVFGKQAVVVVNRDDPRTEALVPAPLPVEGKAGRGRQARTVSRSVVRFGLDAPRRRGDFGLVVENGMAWLVRAREADETQAPRRGGRAVRAAEADAGEIHLQRLMPADALRVRGRHNAANALAALALATAADCPLAPMLHGLREYAGEPHRLQFVAAVGGVEAYDDSKGTNVGATVAALDGLGADKAPAKLVVILGGDGKGQDFAPLAAPVAGHARAVALIGRDAAAIEAALAGCGVALQRHDSLEAAVAWGFDQARAGDALLLSPACASLDMFRNYAHRAEVFVAAVHAHAADLGEALS